MSSNKFDFTPAELRKVTEILRKNTYHDKLKHLIILKKWQSWWIMSLVISNHFLTNLLAPSVPHNTAVQRIFSTAGAVLLTTSDRVYFGNWPLNISISFFSRHFSLLEKGSNLLLLLFIKETNCSIWV